MGVRFYTDDNAVTFDATEEPVFDWYRKEMSFSTELNEVPVYDKEEKQTKKQAEGANEIDVENVFDAFMAGYLAWLEEQNAAEDDSTTDTAEQTSAMVSGFRNRQEDTSSSIEATQTFSNAFSTYEGLNSSDWWVWTLALDMPENLIQDSNYIIY